MRAMHPRGNEAEVVVTACHHARQLHLRRGDGEGADKDGSGCYYADHRGCAQPSDQLAEVVGARAIGAILTWLSLHVRITS
jgi:hypothetical protein